MKNLGIGGGDGRFNNVYTDHLEAPVGDILPIVHKRGKVYHVDASISASGDGTTWEKAFKTIAEAIAICDNDYTDDALYYVFIAPGEYVEDDLLFAGHGLQMIGLGNPGSDSGVHILGEAGAAYCVLGLAGANCSFQNLDIQAAGAEPAIYIPAMDNCVFKNCVIRGVPATTTYGIEMKDTRSSKIIDCLFSEAGQGFLTYVIYASGGADQYMIDSEISGNMICGTATSVKGIFIESTCTVYGNVIDRNMINLAAAGGSPKGIDNDAAGVNLITDNYVVMPNGKTPIESASSPTGMIGNHTMAGATVVDPNTAKS